MGGPYYEPTIVVHDMIRRVMISCVVFAHMPPVYADLVTNREEVKPVALDHKIHELC